MDKKRPFKVLILDKQAERGRKKAHHPSVLCFTVALCLFWIGKSIRSWQASEWFSPSVFSQLSPPFVCFFANFKLSDAWNFFFPQLFVITLHLMNKTGCYVYKLICQTTTVKHLKGEARKHQASLPLINSFIYFFSLDMPCCSKTHLPRETHAKLVKHDGKPWKESVGPAPCQKCTQRVCQSIFSRDNWISRLCGFSIKRLKNCQLWGIISFGPFGRVSSLV